MNTKNTGGPAFPSHEAGISDPREQISGGGLSVRDYFAAHAPITVDDAMLACGCDAASIGMLPRAQRTIILAALTEMRVDYADAMLAEREKT